MCIQVPIEACREYQIPQSGVRGSCKPRVQRNKLKVSATVVGVLNC